MITLGNLYSINSDFDELIFATKQRTQNGSQIYGQAIATGRTIVTGTFEQLKASAEIHVYEKLELQPSIVFVPYDSNQLRWQKIQYKAVGGDSSYAWSTLNKNLLAISQSGLAEIRSANEHEPNAITSTTIAQVQVALQRNNRIRKTGDILFLPAVKLEIVRYNYETVLNDYIYLHIALYSQYENKMVPMTFCDNIHFEYDMIDEVFQRADNTNMPHDIKLHSTACHLIRLHARGVGTSHFRISYTNQDLVLKDEVNLVVFERLEIANPVSNEIILPLGASRNIMYRNGPTKVFNIDAELLEEVCEVHKIWMLPPLVF